MEAKGEGMEDEFFAYSDEKLVSFCRNGAKERETAFAELVKRYHPRLVQRAYLCFNNVQEAEDVVQETWVGVLRNLANFNPARKFRSWVFGILHNKTVDNVRRKKEFVHLFSRSSPSPPGEEEAIKETLDKCVSKLPSKYRETVCLLLFSTGFEEYAKLSKLLRDIPLLELVERFQSPLGDLLDCFKATTGDDANENTLKTRRYRAMRMLQQCLRRQGFAPENF